MLRWIQPVSSRGLDTDLRVTRTVAVWNKSIWIVIPLVLISLGQWGILFHGVTTVHAFYDPVTKACQVAQVDGLWLNLVYLWSTSFQRNIDIENLPILQLCLPIWLS